MPPTKIWWREDMSGGLCSVCGTRALMAEASSLVDFTLHA